MEGTDMFYVKIWLTEDFFTIGFLYKLFSFFQTEKFIDCFRIKAKTFEVGT
jgi:hypothetical protein